MTDRLGREILYLSRGDVVACGPNMVEIVDALAAMFREKAEGRVDAPPKIGIHPAPDAFLHEDPNYKTWTPRIHGAPAAP